MHAVWFASLEGKIKAEQVLRYSCVLFENIKNAKSCLFVYLVFDCTRGVINISHSLFAIQRIDGFHPKS